MTTKKCSRHGQLFGESCQECDRLGIKTQPCKTCGALAQATECDGCWEVEMRLADYLQQGPKAVLFVRAALEAFDRSEDKRTERCICQVVHYISGQPSERVRSPNCKAHGEKA